MVLLNYVKGERQTMDEKVIISAKTQNIPIGILIMVIGVVIAATCLVWETILGDWAIFASAAIGAVIALCGLIIIFMSHGSGLYVTDKRVYGKTLLGKRVDIPLDSISSISLTFVLLSGVSVASSSGLISFFFVEERNKIHEIMSNLLIERQNAKNKQVVETKNDTADELKKFKELLDSGVITQEEFDAKKKQLLGL